MTARRMPILLRERSYQPNSGWTIVICFLPRGFGYLVRLEDGPLFRAPAAHLGLLWWWTATYKGARVRALEEIRKAPRRRKDFKPIFFDPEEWGELD